ncbi:hypothetical protein [Fangia hongkongensis]|uniref:hypothetical protein n=1 Tax=Fangia hongkongensis TaxID=270495 RepID=UPI00036997E4|nr:hypothetical protein [Fangia hongkongensis]MBK2125109.1 hypothetical protein [Fangia hongkongensis]
MSDKIEHVISYQDNGIELIANNSKHTIQILIDADQDKYELKLKNMSLMLDNANDKLWMKNNKGEFLLHGGSLSIKADDISITANKSVSISGKQSCNISTNGQAKLSGTTGVEVQSKSVVDIKGSPMVNISSLVNLG